MLTKNINFNNFKLNKNNNKIKKDFNIQVHSLINKLLKNLKNI